MAKFFFPSSPSPQSIAKKVRLKLTSTIVLTKMTTSGVIKLS